MLHFKYNSLTKAKISFDEASRKEFDILRESFKTENVATKFMKSYRFSANPFTYVITPLGSYNVGITDELCKKCDDLNISYDVDEELIKLIKPSLNINQILDVQIKNFNIDGIKNN